MSEQILSRSIGLKTIKQTTRVREKELSEVALSNRSLSKTPLLPAISLSLGFKNKPPLMPMQQGTCAHTGGNDIRESPSLSFIGCLLYSKVASIGNHTIIVSLEFKGQGAATSILEFLSFD